MHLVRGEKSMETVNASVVNSDEKFFIKFRLGDAEICIPMSEDDPNAVKDAFNKIIIHIKSGDFEVKLGQAGDDLFSQVANEYLAQLNREIKEVRSEMSQYGLL